MLNSFVTIVQFSIKNLGHTNKLPGQQKSLIFLLLSKSQVKFPLTPLLSEL